MSKILIVDDVADNRAILARRLVRRGFDVTEAAGGRAALEVIAREQFDVVLLDIMMPDLDGIEVLKQIRAIASPAVLPVIMVTAHSQGEDVVQAIQLGANDYITKPVDFPVALARLEAQITRKQAEDAARRAKEDLERRVETRTLELSQLNAKLAGEIEERRRSEAQMQHMAHHDALTGLANRVLFHDRLSQALERAQRNGGSVAVLCLDLDHFKEINDTLGHPAGDALLRLVAKRLSATVRGVDTVARLGGDEFAIIQADVTSPDSVGLLAERLLQLFEEEFDLGGTATHTASSIGAGIYPQHGASADDLLKAADIALYRAKADGRGTFRLFENGMSEVVEERRGFEQDLRRALGNNEFELHYQPLVSLETKTVLACEALLRWRHPVRGLVSPVDFIPVAENIGIIVEIGEWVLKTACAEAAHWPPEIKVAVNLSPVQFTKPGLVECVARALSDAHLEPTRLELEITESLLLGNTEPVLDTLAELKSLGIEIAMDDFGTGYSSLGYLRKFAFDKIKVDRSFVSDLGASKESAAIVRAVVGLAAGLGMATLAEGVETEAQIDSLIAEGCSQAQGYYFSRPRPAADIRAVLREPLALFASDEKQQPRAA